MIFIAPECQIHADHTQYAVIEMLYYFFYFSCILN